MIQTNKTMLIRLVDKTMDNKTVTMELWWQKPDFTRRGVIMKG